MQKEVHYHWKIYAKTIDMDRHLFQQHSIVTTLFPHMPRFKFGWLLTGPLTTDFWKMAETIISGPDKKALVATVLASAANKCQYQWRGSSCEQVWTGLKGWSPDITSWGRGHYIARFHVGGGRWGRGGGSPVHWGLIHHGNCHMGTPCGQNGWLTDRHDWKHNRP